MSDGTQNAYSVASLTPATFEIFALGDKALSDDYALALVGPFPPPRPLHRSVIAGFKHAFKSIPLEDEIIDGHTGERSVGTGQRLRSDDACTDSVALFVLTLPHSGYPI